MGWESFVCVEGNTFWYHWDILNAYLAMENTVEEGEAFYKKRADCAQNGVRAMGIHCYRRVFDTPIH